MRVNGNWGGKKLHWSGTNNASLRSLTSQPTGHWKRKEDELTSDMINERDKCWYREDKRKGRMMVVEKKESVFFKPPAKSSKPDFWIIEIYVILLLSQKSPWERTSKAGSTDFFFFFSLETKMGFWYTERDPARMNLAIWLDVLGLMFLNSHSKKNN